MGWGLSSRVGELSELLRFKIGLKQYDFGFHAEFLASGGGSEAQTQRETENVQRPFFQQGLWGPDGMKGPK